MDLLELSETIAKARETIIQHEAILKASLANTRDALISPTLKALGWDTANPNQYLGEYRPSQEPGICALMDQENAGPMALLVTKRLGEPISAYEINRAAATARETGTQNVGGTNGAQWKLYRGNNLVLEVDVTQGRVEAVAAGLAPLWKDAMAGTETAPKPIPIPTPTQEARKTLATLTGDDPLPTVMTFPNGKEHEIIHWKHYLVGVARWLYDTGIVDEAKITAQASDRKSAAMVISAPEERDKDELRKQHTNVRGDVWIRTTYNRGSIVRAARRHLSDAGVDPDQVEVTFYKGQPAPKAT